VIPADFIAEWRAHARWPTDEQVEQDLALSRALVEIFDDAELAGSVSLRGGTALHKLPPRRSPRSRSRSSSAPSSGQRPPADERRRG
jgi:hypothetical protein